MEGLQSIAAAHPFVLEVVKVRNAPLPPG
jgi:hypothetical protein